MVFVNKMDRVGADYYGVISNMRDRLNANVVPIAIPIGVEDTFVGVINLVDMKEIVDNPEDKGVTIMVQDIREELKEKANEYREKLIESLADADDLIAEKYLEGKKISNEEIKQSIRKSTIAVKIFPMTCGTAFKNKGVHALLDNVIEYFPSPLEVPPIKGFEINDRSKELIRKPDDSEPFASLSFKIMTDPHVGRLSFLRIYSGFIKKGNSVLNVSSGKKERIGRLLRMHANTREQINEAYAGDIVACVGLKASTGDTLCSETNPIQLESMVFPDPVIKVEVEPNSKIDQEKMSVALKKLEEEDPTFKIEMDQELGQTLISGMGELHLEIIVDRLKREFKVHANVGKPQVAFREAIKKTTPKIVTKYIKQTGGRGQYGHVVCIFEPGELGGGFVFENLITGGRIPKEYITPIKQGIEEAMKSGILAGYPMMDLKVKLIDGSYHDVDSSEIAFKIAGSLCFKEGVSKGDPCILEPIFSVDVDCPEIFMGDVIGDLNSRRGKILGMEDVGKNKLVKAHVPLFEMFGYATDLRSKTQGRAIYSMEFHSYQEVPKGIADGIIKKAKGACA
jgi:elongation factor G